MFMLGAVIIAVAALGISQQLGAAGDETVVVRQEIRPTAGGAGREETRAVSWTPSGRVRVDEGEVRSIVFAPDGRRAFLLDHGNRSWREIEPGAGPRPADRDPGALAVTVTDETRLVAGVPCRRYVVRRRSPLGNAAPPLTRDSEVWASGAAGAAPPPLALAALLGIPLLPRDADVDRELAKIPGLPVLQVERLALPDRVEERETRLVDVATRTVPAGTWEVPPGYTPAGP